MKRSGTTGYRPQYERIAEQIQGYITEHHLQPGDRLPTEQELGEQFGVSRTIVRDAVKVLTPLGLLRTRRGSGIYVGQAATMPQLPVLNPSSPVQPENMRELFEFRRFQEMQTAALAAQRITVAELKALDQWLTTNRQAAKSEDRDTFLSSDDAFHRGIALAAHNMFYVQSVTTVLQLQRWAVHIITGGAPGSSLAAVEQHTAIFEAVRDGEPDRAAEAARAHVDSVFAAYEREVRRRVLDGSHGE
jgi:GntR family transcriptional regulator, transcriptional repressor for pyruvate dehydrogenase complex